ELPPCICTIQRYELGANWCARDFSSGFWEKGRAFLETEHDCIHYSRRPAIGFSRDSVRFMNKSGYPTDAPGQHWCGGRAPTHAEHSVRFKLAIQRPAQ